MKFQQILRQNCFLTFFFLLFALAANAAEPSVWQVNTRAEVLKGDARGVSITDTGAIILAPRLTEVFNTGQSFVWSSAMDAAGNIYLGTGSDGRLFKVGADGKGALFADFNELDVTAVVVGRDGALFAATSPDGKVYRIDATGKADVYFDPADKYIWSLALMNDGGLAVGTGENGKIYRVRTANAAADSSLLFDSGETHIISLATDKQNNLIAGTDASGIVLRIAPDGKAFALLDAPAPLREIHDVSVAPDGSVYVLALSDSASASNTGAAGGTISGTGGASVTVTSTTVTDEATAATTPPRSRNDLTNTKSAIFRIAPDGGSEVVWSSTTVTGFSIYANQNGVLLGTSDKGRIYSITADGRETLLLQTNQGQISKIMSDGKRIFANSSNQGKLYQFGGDTLAEGSFESTVRDAKNSALWGRIWWRGGGNVQLQTRTGNTEKPDGTWSDWSAIYTDAGGAQIQSPKARFLQWRAILKNTAGAANLSEVNVSYQPQNIAPEILRIEILPTNVGLQSNPLPPSDPNIDNSGLDPSAFGLLPMQIVPPRRLYQRGARALQWTAEDRNADKLEYSVFYRATNEQNFRLLKSNLRENFYTLDGAALSDGSYVFKVAVSDAPSNPAGQNLTSERNSESIEIDNTPPTVTAQTPNASTVTFEAADGGSGLRRAEYSVNGQDWQIVYAADGISDSRAERYTVQIPATAGEQTISLRAFDANGNVGSFRVNVRR